MVEEIKYEETNYVSTSIKKNLTLLFYLFNLNLYLISILSFENSLIKVLYYILINSFIFRSMFGIPRFNRILVWHILTFILYLIYFEGWVWQHVILIITTIINYFYHSKVLENGLHKQRSFDED